MTDETSIPVPVSVLKGIVAGTHKLWAVTDPRPDGSDAGICVANVAVPANRSLAQAALEREWGDRAGETGETRVTNAKTGGEKGSKPERMSLLPFDALRLVSKVYAFGAQKYAPNNWRKGYDWSLSFDALHRHLESFWNRDELDDESGLPHIAHAAFHVLALVVFSTMERYAELDDRPRVHDEGEIDAAARVAE